MLRRPPSGLPATVFGSGGFAPSPPLQRKPNSPINCNLASHEPYRPLQPLCRVAAGHGVPCAGVAVGALEDTQGAEGGERLPRPGRERGLVGKGGNGVLHGVADDVGQDHGGLGAGDGLVGTEVQGTVQALAADVPLLHRVPHVGAHGGGDALGIGKGGEGGGGHRVGGDAGGLHGRHQKLQAGYGGGGLEVALTPHAGAVHEPPLRHRQNGGGVSLPLNIRVGHGSGTGRDPDGDGGRGAVIAVDIPHHVVEAVLTRKVGVGGVDIGSRVAVGKGDAAVGGVAGDLVGDLIPLGIVGRHRPRRGKILVGLDLQGDGGCQGHGGRIVQLIQQAEAAGHGVIAPVDRHLQGGLCGLRVIGGGEGQKRQAPRRDHLPLSRPHRANEQGSLAGLGELADGDVVQLREVHGAAEILGGEGDLVAAKAREDQLLTGGQHPQAVGYGQGGLPIHHGVKPHRGTAEGLRGGLSLGYGDDLLGGGGEDGGGQKQGGGGDKEQECDPPLSAGVAVFHCVSPL